ncbi:MAG: UDP-glucose 4-epimerase GalE [Acidobacteria bacterium]|nr:UDP-glucose 4-epimerase GalE [Acidobacteriota bacterium]
MATILVTGGAGYIGSHAVKALLASGDRVVVYDNLSAGHSEAVAALARRFGGERVSLVRDDIRNVDAVRRALRDHGADAVMHFAAWLSVGESVRDPIGYYRNNVAGALSVLEAMAAEGVTSFVFSSTAAVFGNPIETPITEGHPTQPINAYGETKLAIERALPHFERAYGLSSVVLRYFNAAGADPEGDLGEDHDPELHLIPLALAATQGGTPLSVFGDDYPTPDGTCLRDYIHVSDLADAHVLALRHLRARGASASYNLGNGRPTSVREVIEAVERVTGRRVAWSMGTRREGDPAVLFASSERIKGELGWRPRFEDIDTIVRTAAEWSRPGGGFARNLA